jgi:Mn-dependent DtxR family transcriptional regulator
MQLIFADRLNFFHSGRSCQVSALDDSSTAVQDYLEQIHQLIEAKGYARAVEIAANLGVSQASVSAMSQRLDAEGFVGYEKYRGVVMTEKGREIARQIVQRHEVLTRLLRRFGIDEETIYRDVEGMEHHISVQTLSVLTLLTEELENNPDLARRLKRRMESRAGGGG